MASTLKPIKQLKQNSANISDILKSFVFGDTDIKEYNPNTIYMKGNLIIKLNEITGKYEVLHCKTDNITGIFNINNWSITIVNDIVIQDIINNNLIKLSETEPDDINNQIWFQTIAIKS